MSSLTLLFCIVILVWFWLASLNCRDIAIRTGRASCAHQGLQFLDDTVSLRNLRPYYRNVDDLGIRRTYVFDYSGDGISRQTGCIVLHNTRVTSVVFEASRNERHDQAL
ncbi:MAG: DUF3301 domain-containing protein [Gammaproteobacteria bacterium]|nr:DUF3301 domain-containing protein [Gammaproteobacteria bacterium]